MQARGDLIRAVIDFCRTNDAEDQQRLRKQIAGLLDVAASADRSPVRDTPLLATVELLEPRQYPLRHLGVDQVAEINAMLPWAALTADIDGKLLGSAWNTTKRASQQALVEERLRDFVDACPLEGKHVLEVGCFEGIHTISCLSLGARVTAVDSRMENILKTLARLWAYGYSADVQVWNLEEREVPPLIPAEWDVLHHIGVLYHLTNPAENLGLLASRTREALILDTHVATDETATKAYSVDGRRYRYQRKGERRISPFAGMMDHAKWLLVEDLIDICKVNGLKDIRRCEVREERNGARLLLWAFR